jgi:peroxiredoxin Q/BCP
MAFHYLSNVRMPAQVILEKTGAARYLHYGKSMQDIPENQELLLFLDSLNENV